MQKYTINDFNRDFPDDDSCLEQIVVMLYPEGIDCRKCGEKRPHAKLTNRKAYSCDYCGTHVYPLAGTIFEKSSSPLKSWFYAMFLMASTRCGISAKQLERELGVTYKTAWRMFNQIRKLLGEELANMENVEVDETYVGGKRRGTKRGRPGADSHKTPVFGIVERGGKVAALVTKDTKRATVMPIIEAKVLPESMIYSDEYHVYDTLGQKGYRHERVNHSQEIYVVGNVHTNTIEGFWSLFKNGIRGVYHSVSSKHLQGYADEYAFRYNHRDDEQAMYAAIEQRVKSVRAGQHGSYSPLG
jgi:transposase